MALSTLQALEGCIFGTAVGDSLGLPYEGLGPGRINALKAIPLRQRFLFGYGMVSDDTEHTCMVAQCLIESASDVARFEKKLAWRMRWWFLALPAGIGFATLRALLKLWLGFSPKYSGINSAGNGPAMRSALIGVYAGDNEQLLKDLLKVNTCITHTDPRALRGATIVARAAYLSAKGHACHPGACSATFAMVSNGDEELQALLKKCDASAEKGETAREFCLSLGRKKISGYVYHTLAMVLQVWMRYPYDFSKAMEELIACGGDTDTAAAILGAIIGAGTGRQGIEAKWLDKLWDWPRSPAWMVRLCSELDQVKSSGQARRAPLVFFPAVLLRNTAFMIWVLLHGFRRLLPPY